MLGKVKWMYLIISGMALTLLLVLSVQHSNKTFADNNPVNITTTPGSVLFDVTNMKPGDWAERQLMIQNRGEADFSYFMEVEKKSGSQLLYEGLILKMETVNGLIYEGKLSEFHGFDPRPLIALHEEELTLTVMFPSHLGNEYQGLEVEVEFSFVANGKEVGGVEEDADSQQPIDKEILDKDRQDDHILPQTASNSYNFIMGGIALIIIGTFTYMFYRKKRAMSELN